MQTGLRSEEAGVLLDGELVENLREERRHFLACDIVASNDSAHLRPSPPEPTSRVCADMYPRCLPDRTPTVSGAPASPALAATPQQLPSPSVRQGRVPVSAAPLRWLPRRLSWCGCASVVTARRHHASDQFLVFITVFIMKRRHSTVTAVTAL